MMCQSAWALFGRVLVLQLCGLWVLAGSTAVAEDEIENALVNGDFDLDVTSWEARSTQVTGSNEVTITFDSGVDVDGDSSSGAALVSNVPMMGHLRGSMVQCVTVDPLHRYAFEGSLYVASEQGVTVIFRARFDVSYYGGEDCAGDPLLTQSTDSVRHDFYFPSGLDTWQTYTLPEQFPPEEAGSARVWGMIECDGGTAYGHAAKAWFDAVTLSVPEPSRALQQGAGLLVLLGLARRRVGHRTRS